MAAENLFYKEVNLIGGYSQEDQWVAQGNTLKNSVGFEDYRTFSNEYGDFLTTDLQMRLAYDAEEDRGDAWAIEIHNAWLQFKAGVRNKVVVGHFAPAFGLEPMVDTHGTILQTLAIPGIGFKKDWGVSAKGIAPAFDYMAALQLGSGMSLRRKDGSYLATARIGSPAGRNVQFGGSLLLGDVLQSAGTGTIPPNTLLSDEAVERKRIGLDGQYIWGPAKILAEGAYGEDEDDPVLGVLGQVEYTPPKYQNWGLEFQYKSWVNDLDRGGTDDTAITVGAAHKWSASVTLRATYIHDIHKAAGEEDDTVLAQIYYFGL